MISHTSATTEMNNKGRYNLVCHAKGLEFSTGKSSFLSPFWSMMPFPGIKGACWLSKGRSVVLGLLLHAPVASLGLRLDNETVRIGVDYGLVYPYAPPTSAPSMGTRWMFRVHIVSIATRNLAFIPVTLF